MKSNSIKTEISKAANRGKTSHLLRNLREHGNIKKIPHSQRYLLTSTGRQITGTLIETKNISGTGSHWITSRPTYKFTI